MRRGPELRCPSAQAGAPDAIVLGVISSGPNGRRVAYLNEQVLATAEILSQAEPVTPGEVFRVAARCQELECAHFDGVQCQLAARIVKMLPEVTPSLPPCTIRRTCRWYQQEGQGACMRCPQIVTLNSEADELLKEVAGLYQDAQPAP